MYPKPTWIYHITHLENLDRIITSNGLMALSLLNKNAYTNIAHKSLQVLRESTPVPLTPYGYLHDYVPFYFAPRSPMLYAIHKNNVDGYTGGQKPILHLVSTVQKVIKNECTYIFTDGHGIMFFTEFFNHINDLSKIDWNIMNAKYWGDTSDDGDRKRRRMAEFLVHHSFDWSMIIGIGVINEQVAQKVSNIIDGHAIKHKPQIKVKKDWYY